MDGTLQQVDVIVIGGGGAGLASAVSAAEAGGSVILLEKNDHLGGTTSLSVGSITAAGTRLQRRAGIEDSTEAMAEDMVAFRPELLRGDAPHLRTLYARESAMTVAWLEDKGVTFTGPYPEPPHRVPRMHNVVPNSRVYIQRLQEAARRLGVRMVLRARTSQLLANGAVSGVRIGGPDGQVSTLHARRGVILATGDFSGNEEMRRQYLPADAAAARPINPAADGSGHRLAMELGAQTQAMDVTFGPQLRFPEPESKGLLHRLPTWRCLCRLEAAVVQRVPASALRPFVRSLLITHMSPSPGLFEHGAILVNAAGKRFCDERASVSSLANQPGGRGFIVLDESIAKLFNTPPNSISTAPGIAFAYFDDYRRGRPDLVHSASTVDALADVIRVSPAALLEAVRSARLSPPYHAMGPLLSMLTVTEGALKVDGGLRVLGRDGLPIPGLYAAGGIGQGGMLLLGHGHHIGWAMTSGRLAGALAAKGSLAT